MHRPRATFLALVPLLAACGSPSSSGVYLDDDLSFDLISARQDHLEAPYVAGTALTLFVNAVDAEATDFSAWSVESSDPEVFEILEVSAHHHDLDAEARAVSPGTAMVEVYDAGGRLVHETPVSVALPDRVEVQPQVRSFVPTLDEAPLSEAPQVLVLHPTTFEVQYWAGGEQLAGHGALEVHGPAALDLQVGQSHLSEAGEWLHLEALEAGSWTVELGVGGEEVGSLEVVALELEALVGIQLVVEEESGATSGETLHAVALGLDEAGSFIYGLTPSWELGASRLEGHGDVLAYGYDPEHLRPLAVALGELQAETWIHGRSGSVESSADVGCASVASPVMKMSWLLGMLGVLGVRRREQVSQS